MEEPKLLHVYEHYAQHDEVWMVGNVDGLLALRNAIDAVLNKAEGNATSVEVMASDGEGYNVHVVCEDSPWQGERWQHLFMPYTAEYARDVELPSSYMPWHLLTPKHVEKQPDDGS